MLRNDVIEGYETEIAYQKNMLENLGRWFSLTLLLASSGLILSYSFFHKNLLFLIIGVLLAVLGIVAMLVIGYAIYKGRQNLQRVISDFESKVKA